MQRPRAVDGKRNFVRCPQFIGSCHVITYLKNNIILFALVDAYYSVTYVDVGAEGQIGDAGAYAKSVLRCCMIDRTVLIIP